MFALSTWALISLVSLVVASTTGKGHIRAAHANAVSNVQAREQLLQVKSVDHYRGWDFFDDSLWTFTDGPDSNSKLTKYVSKSRAREEGLAYVWKNKTYLRVDGWTNLTLNKPRDSVRLSAVKKFSGGLLVADFKAMPSACGIWPAFWTVGDDWPNGGEIDIVEGVDGQSTNQYTFHSGMNEKCSTRQNTPTDNGTPSFTANTLGTDCRSEKGRNAGCAFSDVNTTSFGPGFNKAGGGVFALLWDTDGLKIWHFDRQSIPHDVHSSHPNPYSWPPPKAFLSAKSCNVASSFKSQRIILNTAVCGGWATGAYKKSGCPGTCDQQATIGHNFINAKWVINNITVYNS